MDLIYVAGYFLLLVLAILWLILPFALFGMKSLLRDLIREQQRTNALLENLQLTRPTTGSVAADAARAQVHDATAAAAAATGAPAINAPLHADASRRSRRMAAVLAILAILLIVALVWWQQSRLQTV